jgi:hypothetical protein
VLVRRKLPDDLQSSLEERFSRFLAAQAEDHREELTELLGTCARQAYDGKCYKSYTASYKLCMVERMQEVRMLDFDFSTQNLFINTTFEEMEPIDGPVNRFAAERSPWHMRGDRKVSDFLRIVDGANRSNRISRTRPVVFHPAATVDAGEMGKGSLLSGRLRHGSPI